jgi:hypothetical protein
MVNNVRTFFYIGLSRRVSSVAAISACILCFSPLPAICLAINRSEPEEFVSNVVTHISDGNSNHLMERFNELEGVIQSSGDPLNESRKFLQSFIGEINTRYGLNLTIHEACALVRENLHIWQLP